MKTIFSSYKRAKELPVHAVCRNCQTKLSGPYCHICGQNVFIGSKRSFRDIVFNTLENMFAVDHKLLITLKYLLFFPGHLTREYINGRIVSYVHPSKLFWFVSIFFFMFLTYNLRKQSEKVYKIKDLIEQEAGSTLAGEKNGLSINGLTKDQLKYDEGNVNQIASSFLGLNKDIDLTGYLTSYSPYISFLLIPFFALLLYTLYRRKNYFYADYMAFALHFHAYIFLLAGSYLGIRILFPGFNTDTFVFMVLPLLYFIIASWVVFKPKPFALIYKSFLLVI
ncbi:MAG: DUF3667 domain-containing protein, partial [Bacteroidales bacterium]